MIAMKETVCLQQWVDEQKRLLRSFELMWKSQLSLDPENFPKELKRGDWAKQFDFYCSEVDSSHGN